MDIDLCRFRSHFQLRNSSPQAPGSAISLGFLFYGTKLGFTNA